MTKETLPSTEFKRENWETKKYHPTQDSWKKNGRGIREVYNKAFDYLKRTNTFYVGKDRLKSRFEDNKNIAILLSDTAGKINGFSLAIPAVANIQQVQEFTNQVQKQYPDAETVLAPYLKMTESIEAQEKTAYIEIYQPPINLQQYKKTATI